MTSKTQCAIEDCNRDAVTRGWCQRHYRRWWRYGDPLKTTYNVDGPKPVCSVPDCGREANNTATRPGARFAHLGPLCGKHYVRAFQGRPLRPAIGRERGDGTYIGGYRYVKAPDRSSARKNKYIAEHRLVMEEVLGRHLLPHENVHHINGVRSDNRIENLELWSSSQPKGQRARDKLEWAREIIALYEPNADAL
jgi:hypothetical protein